MNTVTDKEMVKLAVAGAKRAINRFPAHAVAHMFDAEVYFDLNFHLCTVELRAEMVRQLKASAFYKNRNLPQ